MLPHYLWNIKVQICNKLCTESTFSRSVMVSVGISMLSLKDLIFVDLGLKINGGYYRDMLLSQQLLPVMRDVSGDFFIFQQDSASAHRARDTVRCLEQSTPAFAPPDLWPPDSTDINPVDYKMWGDIHSSSECISRSCTALANWRSVCWTLGVACTTASLTMQLTSGISVFQCMCGQKADILCKCCKLPNRVMRYFIFSSNRRFVSCREF